MATYSIREDGKVLNNSLITSYLHSTQEDCELKCLDAWNCKSFNIELSGDQRCELNNKTTEDIRDRVSLSIKSGWSFITTDYKNQWVRKSFQHQPYVITHDATNCHSEGIFHRTRPLSDDLGRERGHTFPVFS